MSVEFTIAGVPTSWARAGSHGARRYTPGKQRLAGAIVAELGAQAMGSMSPLEGPLRMEVEAVWCWPASFSKKRRNAPGASWRTARPDCDNCGKLIADSLIGVCFVDDAQIVRLEVTKRYGDRAETRVCIARASG